MNKEGKILVAVTLLEKYKNEIDEREKQAEQMKNDRFSIGHENSSSESEEELLLTVLASSKRKRRHVIKIQNYVEIVVAAYDEEAFQQIFRLTRQAYELVLREVSQNWKEDTLGRKQISINRQLLAVIWLLATPDSYRSVSEHFDLSKSNLSRCFVRVINALNETASKYIKIPSGAELAATKAKFAVNSPFKDLVGVVDGTYVPIKVPNRHRRSYTNRKGFVSMTLQCICDAEMVFLDCYTGWPSSVPDIRVFKNSDIFLQCQENEWGYFPNGEYILGDKAYPCLSWCIPPYMRRRRLTNAQTVFNKKHASARVIIENSFSLLFGRFRRLRDLDMNRLDWIPSTILACCVLHNICLKFNDSRIDEFISEGRPTVRRIDANQDPDDYENGVEDGITKRDRLCNEIN